MDRITPNTKVTALDILNQLGIENAEEVFGKMRVRIAGISGINKPDRLIMIQSGVDRIDVIVGLDHYELVLLPERQDEKEFTENAKVALEAKGAQTVKQNEELRKAKKLNENSYETEE